jgi:hypothetical protein
VDPERDDLSLYPLLYWPMDPRAKSLSPKALSRISDYMRNGGTILFDTRDFTLGAVRGPASPGEQTLRRLTTALDLPPLEPVPADHVLTKTFYILRDFPGRWSGGKLWVEALPPAPKNGAPPRARRRWRVAGDCGRQRLGQRLGGGFQWPLHVHAVARRRIAARNGVPLRHQSGDVCPDGKLQSRCGACAGFVAAAGQ